MKEVYSRYFPTPSYLAMNSCALDISDQSIKYGELNATSMGLRLGKFGHLKIPPGVINSGKIENEAELVRILKDVAAREHLHFVRISLPEEQMYLFTMALPSSSGSNIREAIELGLEEHIPLKALDTIFDFKVATETKDTIYVRVLALAIPTMESYLSVFKKSGLVPLSFEIEAQAIARAVIPRGDLSPVMIVDFGSARTGASIAHNGKIFFTTTLDIGGISITEMIAKNFNISFEKAEEMKLSYGIGSTSNADDIFPAILNGISVLRDELNRHYIYWKTHEDDGFKHEKLDRIILSGGDANLTGLSNYLEASMNIKVENANIWQNVSDMGTSVPSIAYEESFGYATVIGLALADYMSGPEVMINVLPEREKKSLKREYWLRFATVFSSFIAVLLTLSTVLFLPSYLFSISKSNVASSRLEAFNAANPEISTNTISSAISDINYKLTLLSPSGPETIPSMILQDDIISSLPAGITLAHLLYSEDSESHRMIDLGGKAVDRATLRTFKANLEQNPHIASVNLPISDFLERSDLDFNISLVLK